MALHLRPVAPQQGARWVRQGFRAFMLRPMGFCALLLGFFFTSLLVSVLIPLVGSVVSLMALPLLSLGFMVATESALRGGPVHPGQLVEPLVRSKARRGTLLKLCALYGVVTLAALLLSELVIGDAWEHLRALYASGQQATPEQVKAVTEDPRLVGGLGLQAGLIALLSIPFWHAPALVLWGEQGVAQSLFSSTLAVWRSKGAFAVYSLVWLALTIVAGTLAALVFGLLGMGQFAPVAALPLALMGMTVFYASLYFTFTDSFGAADTPATPA
ncbi:BPSS1780 family membrane protein [Ideonella sp. BN130291]|uniref:BPSS1780 family membrane protein n=1 Tax=Ideonella sp. BN130291 TaxID=3112940 RepID=UPI002E253B1F|nr:BPSS1780 family membrane protein [Ideonella sp. BN130291]